MHNTRVLTAVARVLMEKFHVNQDQIKSDIHLNELGLDSLQLMEFVFAIEDEFKVRIPEDQLDLKHEAATLGSMVQTIQDHLDAVPKEQP